MDEVNCLSCEYYDAEDDRCRAFDCWPGVDCTAPLPCEENDNDVGGMSQLSYRRLDINR